MIAIAYYLLKLTVISGLLFGFYYLALKDKVFHQWNRFYLLASIILSLTMPLCSIPVVAPEQHDSNIITALQVVTGADEYVSSYKAEPVSFISAETITTLLFSLVSLVILGILLSAFIRVFRMTRLYDHMKLDDVYFINTREPGTPFSFFRYIFWNEEIDIQSENGRRIFEHELVHVRERHSLDKLFIHAVLIFFWINPFFWLIRSELNIIHEFIADKKSIGGKDSSAFAELILQAAYPQYQHIITNPFFQSSIKRRLNMITKSNNPALNYLSRISALLVAVCILLAFTLKTKKPVMSLTGVTLDKKITVIIDAGHGGDDQGANSAKLTEKNINLLLARQVKAMNKDQQLNIILTRENDKTLTLQERVRLVTDNNADLFISLHTAADPQVKSAGQPSTKTGSGIEVYVSGKNTTFEKGNLRLANILLQNLSAVYTVNQAIKTPETGVYVLDHNSIPAVILECGYITNKKDMDFITVPANQQKIAEAILKSINQYFSSQVSLSENSGNPVTTSVNASMDTMPKGNKPARVTSTNTTANTVKSANIDSIVETNVIPKVATTVNSVVNANTNPKVVTSVNSSVNTNVDPKVVMNVNTSVNTNVKTKVATTVNTKVNTSVQTKVATTVNTQDNSSKNSKNQTITISVSDSDQKVSMDIQKDNEGNIRLTTSKPSPLFVLDGKIVSEAVMKTINPEMIQRIDVLKDDSAVKPYGENGKHGVVVITTKK